jgi:LuxR family maltose regulon positive regulatory protein
MMSARHDSTADIFRPVVHDLVRAVESGGAGDGRLLLVTGPRGSGRSGVLRAVLMSLPGWRSAHAAALPWHGNDSGGLARHLAARLGTDGGLDDAVDVPGAMTVLAVDDAQWADTETVQELVSLARRSTRGRVAVILSLPEGAGGDNADLLREVADNVSLLPPLDLRDVRAFALAISGTRLGPGAVAQLQDLTGGRPGLIREVLDSVPGDHWRASSPAIPVPESWRAAMEDRLDAATGHGRSVLPVLQAVALFPEGAPTDLVRTLTADDGTGIDHAVSLGFCLVNPSPGHPVLRLVSPSDRAVLTSMTPPGRSAAMHRVAAEYFAEMDDTDASLRHRALALTTPDGDLADTVAARGHELGATGYWRRAASFLTLASEVAPESSDAERYRLDAAEAMLGASDIPAARLHTRALSPVGPGGTAAVQRHSVLGYLALHEGRRAEATNHIDAASAQLEADGPDGEDIVPRELASRVASRQALLNLAEWRPEKVVTWMDRADRWATVGAAARTESQAIALIAHGAITGRMPDEPVDDGSSGLHVQRRHMAMGWLSLVFDDPVTARQRLQRRTQVDGSERISLWQDAWLARSQFVMGEWEDAMTTVERGLARAERFGISFLEPLLLWTGAQISLFRGSPGLARNYMNRFAVGTDSFVVEQIPAAMCRLLFSSLDNDIASAIHAGEKLTSLQRTTDISQPGFWPWEDVWAQTLLRAGRFAEAEDVTTRAEERAAASGLLSLQAKLGVPRGNLLIQRGDVEAGLRVLDDAAEAISTLPMPSYQSRILFEYGQLLRRLGRRRRADEQFARAAEVYAAMGATTFVERCNRERRAGGLGPRTVDAAGMTPQEKEIAAAVADGATNREVARDLFLSPKTVEYHLTRVYRKLGIRSRSDLARALDDLP